MAITGSLVLPELSRRFGLKRLFLAGTAADVASMTHPRRQRLGRGKGGCVSDAAGRDGVPGARLRRHAVVPEHLRGRLQSRPPRGRAHDAERVLGVGTALSPLLAAFFIDLAEWWYLPLLTGAGLLVLLVVASAQPLVAEAAAQPRGRVRIPPVFWLFAGGPRRVRHLRDPVRQLGRRRCCARVAPPRRPPTMRWRRSGPP